MAETSKKYHPNSAFRRRWEAMLRKSQVTICKAIEETETGGVSFREDAWKRGDNGGGGWSRVLQNGRVFEKAGVNVSAVHGDLSGDAASCMMAQDFTKTLVKFTAGMSHTAGKKQTYKRDEVRFYASGLSLVFHPVNPMAPTVHMNYRMMQIFAKQAETPPVPAASQATDGLTVEDDHSNCGAESSAMELTSKKTDEELSGAEEDEPLSILWWFGGGADLSPAYLFEEDCIHFHQMLREQCDRCDPRYYSRFKRWCDAYFRLHHRNEGRGIGGIFFDDLNEGMTSDPEKFFRFAQDGLQRTFLTAYLPLVHKHKNDMFTPKERVWQQIRRGRYVEFNLVHDRGTKFGLMMPGSRIESILVSLPLTARWEYEHEVGKNSREEAALAIFKQPRDWISLDEEALQGFTVPAGPEPIRSLWKGQGPPECK